MIFHSIHRSYSVSRQTYFKFTSRIQFRRSKLQCRMTSLSTTFFRKFNNVFETLRKSFSTFEKKNDDIVNILEKKCMFIDILSNAKSKFFKIYSIESQNRKFIDQEFDKLHVENKLRWIIEIILYDFSIFVIWRIIHLSSKNFVKKIKVVINIREFNKIIVSNDYFMFFQVDIINLVNDYFYVNVMNAIEFFHQWFVKLIDRHKLIVVSHRESEQWNVAVINFRNNSTYVQRQINRILRKYRAFARAFVNDIVVFNKILKKHFEYLKKIFALFQRMNITFKINKTYLSFFFVVLLD